jgi:spermidine synthase
LPFLKKIISYIYPIISKKIQTAYNGEVEICFQNGKKVLDSQNANYSYGLLQKVLEKGLSFIQFKGIEKILILGMGGGSIIKSLTQKYQFDGHITAVDLDPKIIEIAAQEFAIRPHAKLNIVCSDCCEFLAKNKTQFDLIIVDVFIDNTVPTSIYETHFWTTIASSLSPQGQFLFNAGMSNRS